MLIEELVSMDLEGDFRSDVQLSDYENPALNKELLRKYIFTTQAPATVGAGQRNLAAKDVLDLLKTALTVERYDNRIVLTANYGRGKSHLALALANFFAKPTASDEVAIVLDRLQQALNNPSQWAGYRDFKRSKGECLVVRLQGDAIGDLQEGFVRALEQALIEHEATRNIEIPFWYRNAERWLNGLRGDNGQKAEAFLATQNTDLPSLLAGLRRQGAYEQVRELAKHVTGVYPDFGREISLEDLVIWAVDEVCRPNKLGGLLVLFDEFSLFLQKYVTSRSAGKLQELLNGISKRQGKSVFLAFSQQDVDTVADAYTQGQRREDVKKELERLPKDKRASLYSLMEGVLAAYLSQDEHNWQIWRPQIRGWLTQVRTIVYEYFGKRYSTDLRWNPEAFEERVAKGCFPLHPLTTAILSAHNFEAGAGENPRTALEFVRRAWEDVRGQPAQTDGKPNFVYPIALVDFFGEQLSKKWYAAYRNALETAPRVLSDDERKLLQALFVQQAVNLKATAGAQIALLTHISGLEDRAVKKGIKDLGALKVVNSDDRNKVTQLFPATTRPQEVEELIQKAVEATPIDRPLIDKIASELPMLEVSTNFGRDSDSFGHASDWAPKQVVLAATMFNAEEVKSLLKPYRVGANGIEEGSRGVVVWLAAQSEEERTLIHQTAQAVLDEALAPVSHPLPIVVMLPKRAVPNLIDFTRRLRALERLSGTDRAKIGTVMYDEELERAQRNFQQALDDLVDDRSPRNIVEYVLPGPYRASVQALRDRSLKSVLSECYRQAYAHRVEFYSQFSVGGKGPNNLRKAVRNVSLWLFGDTAGKSIQNLGSKDIQHQLSTLYLAKKWGLLSSGSYSVQRPTSLDLQQAWDLLEATYQPGCNDVAVGPVLITLLNPPYGHDYNTLVLLLAAWIGFHQHEIRLAWGGKMVTTDQLKQFFDDSRSPQEFLNQICTTTPLAISRSMSDELSAQASAVVEKIHQGGRFTIPEAEEALANLEGVLTNPRLPESTRQNIAREKPRLENALRQAQEYDATVSAWFVTFESGGFNEILKLQKSVGSLPQISFVDAAQPSLAEVQKQWDSAIQRALQEFCSRYGRLTDLSDYKAHERELKSARKALEQYPALASLVDDTLERLDQRYAELQRLEGEKTTIARIETMRPSAALHDLYEYRSELASLTDLSPQTSRLRDQKSAQIENSIQQYELIAEMLPQAIERASTREVVRQHRDKLLGNLEQVRDTPLHAPLLEAQERIQHLLDFFEDLKALDRLPRSVPADLDTLEARVIEIENEHNAWLSATQRSLLDSKKEEILDVRRRKIIDARRWLDNVAWRQASGENPGTLLRDVESPHDFLDGDGLDRLAEIKQTLQRQLEDDLVALIEAKFREIRDAETRRRCLMQLQQLMGEQDE